MNKMFKINDVSGQCGEAVQHAEQFLPYAQQKLGFNKPVGVNFVSDPENAKNAFGKTAYYDPNMMEITVFVDKRHVKDILRSLSHELVHHAQCCRGEFDKQVSTGPGYAQKDPHMRKMEAEAYLLGNGFIFRDYEDQLKENSAMNEAKLRKYVKNLITEVLGEDEKLQELSGDESVRAGRDNNTEITAADRGTGLKEGDPTDRFKGGADELEPVEPPPEKTAVQKAEERLKRAEEKLKKKPDDKDLKDRVDSAKAALKRAIAELTKIKKTKKTNENLNESFTLKKDQLLFERLVKKWTK